MSLVFCSIGSVAELSRNNFLTSISNNPKFYNLFVKGIDLKHHYCFVDAQNGFTAQFFEFLKRKYNLNKYEVWSHKQWIVNPNHPGAGRLKLHIYKFDESFVEHAEKVKDKFQEYIDGVYNA